MVDEHPRSNRSHKTTPREDMLITRGAMRNSFAISARIRDELNFEGHVCVTNVNRRNEQCICARRPIQ